MNFDKNVNERLGEENIMRLFKIKDTGNFSEFKEHVFKNGNTEETLEAWGSREPARRAYCEGSH